MSQACTSCGACCACFRVDFSVHEMQDMGGSVPSGLAVDVTDWLNVLLPAANLVPPQGWVPRSVREQQAAQQRGQGVADRAPDRLGNARHARGQAQATDAR